MTAQLIPHRLSLAIDFDGVLHRMSKGWEAEPSNLSGCYDTPVEGSEDAMIKLHRFYNLFILTARPVNHVLDWCYINYPNLSFCKIDESLGQIYWEERHFVGITNRKLPALAYIDDRAVRFTCWKDIQNRFV